VDMTPLLLLPLALLQLCSAATDVFIDCKLHIHPEACTSAVLAFNIASEALQNGNFEHALVVYDISLKLMPLEAAYLNILQAASALGWFDVAQRYVDACLNDETMSADAKAAVLNNMGHVMSNYNRVDATTQERAAEYYKAALKLVPAAAYVVYNWGLSLELQGRWLDAQAKFHEVLHIDPMHCSAMLGIGNTEFYLHRLTDAIQWYQYVARCIVSL
jgi:tetratricopeptide (TPR) repeat protein